jgi:hypothetical protein
MYRWQERAEFRMWLLNLEDPSFAITSDKILMMNHAREYTSPTAVLSLLLRHSSSSLSSPWDVASLHLENHHELSIATLNVPGAIAFPESGHRFNIQI